MLKFKNFLSLVKFSHTIFAMPFAILGYFLANALTETNFQWQTLLYIILCMIFARNAAMAFNRYIDKEIDAKNPRTAIREIPSGIIKPKSALHFVLINSIFFIITSYLINTLTFVLSPIALIIILGYSYTKRFTALCHFVLGLGLSLAPIGAYLSVTGKFALEPIIFSFIVLLWVSGFDILYALQDEDFDKEEDLKSVPSKIGRKKAMILSNIVHIFTALLVIWVGMIIPVDYLYWIGSVIFIGLLFYQHLIINPEDISKINIAFATTNGLASLLYSTFVIADLIT